MDNDDVIAPLNFSYDLATDTLTIEGTRYSGHMFRSETGLGMGPMHQDEVLRIVKKEDGMVTLRSVRDPEFARQFDMRYANQFPYDNRLSE